MPKRRDSAQSNTYRFFVASDSVRGDAVQIDDAELAHQLTNVLRLGVGDQVLLLDNSGWQFTVALTELARSSVRGTVEQREVAAGEPRTKLTLYLALMRPERFEWALQKGTELGVSRFVPLISEHTVGASSELSERKAERWQKIVREAAEQSRRGILPRLAPALPFASACKQAAHAGPALLLWEGNGAQSLRHALTDVHDTPISIFSGPEGGFAESERIAAEGARILTVTLGPRTLRAETAPIAAASAIFYAMGDME